MHTLFSLQKLNANSWCTHMPSLCGGCITIKRNFSISCSKEKIIPTDSSIETKWKVLLRASQDTVEGAGGHALKEATPAPMKVNMALQDHLDLRFLSSGLEFLEYCPHRTPARLKTPLGTPILQRTLKIQNKLLRISLLVECFHTF